MNVIVILREIVEPGTVEFDSHTDALRPEREVRRIPDSDLAAVELAVRLAENCGGSVNLIAWGSQAVEQALREPLAVCEGGILRAWDGVGAESDPLAAVELFSAAIRLKQDPVDLILMGADADGPLEKSVPPMLAAVLDLPVVSGVMALTPTDTSKLLLATRRMGRGVREELEVELPALLTIDARACTLRSVTWQQYLRSFQVDIPVKGSKELGCPPRSSSPSTQLLELVRPRPVPQRIGVPDSALSPDERMSQVLDAGSRGHGGQVVEGQPDELAALLIAFLKEHKFI